MSVVFAERSAPRRVLIADAAPLTRWALVRAFAAEGFETCAVSGCPELLGELMSSQFRLVVSASRFDEEDAVPILRRLASARPDMQFIVLGAPDDPDAATPPVPNLVTVEQPFAVADLLRLAGTNGATLSL